MRLAGGAIVVRGSVDSLCEVDVFAVEVPAGGSVTVRLRYRILLAPASEP